MLYCMSGALGQGNKKSTAAGQPASSPDATGSQLKAKHSAGQGVVKHAKKSNEKEVKKTKKKETHISSNKGKKKNVSSAMTKASRLSDSCPAANCLDLAVSYMGLVRTKVANYQKQTARLNRLYAASGGKAAKQSVFANTLNQLIIAGGGNVSNLTCGTSTTNAGQSWFFFIFYFIFYSKLFGDSEFQVLSS
jgi:hypothetical protein